MGRFEATSRLDVEHSIAQLPWGVWRGAFGPSDGSVGAHANVASALSVLRHAPLYAKVPAEIDDAFRVLERHPLRHGVVYPVAVTIVPFLFDFVHKGSILSARIAELIAEYVAASDTLEPPLRDRLHRIVLDHLSQILSWIGRYDRPAAALAVHVPALRMPYLTVLEGAAELSPFAMLAMIELDVAPGETIPLALELLDNTQALPIARAAAAAFLARFGDRSPALRERIDAALPPSAPAALARQVSRLWTPRIDRPVVAPKILDAEVLFAGEKLVLVRAGDHSVTLPWQQSKVQRGDMIQVGISAHGQPKLVMVSEPDGGVRVIDF